jgi:hypothetical protein
MRAAQLAAVLLLAAPRLAAAQADPGSPADSAFAEPPVPEAAPPAPEVAAPAAPAAAVPARPAPVPAAPAAQAAKHDGAYLGFSFGTGRGDVFTGGTTTKVDDLVPGVSPTTLALMLRCGWASGSLLLGVQLNLVRSQWDVSGVSSAMQLAAFDVVTTLRDHDLGLYVRAGVGPAQLTFEADGTSSQSWNGTEGMLGFGFSSSGFGVGIDYVRQSYQKGAPIGGAGYYLATLSLDFG